MKVSWKSTNYGQVGFHAQCHEYDAHPPLKSLLVDAPPAVINAEREAVAAYLAFGQWASGDFIVPRKMAPDTARAIERAAEPIQVRPGPIDYYPQPLPPGRREAIVSFSPAYSEETASEVSHVSTISVLPADRWNGSLTSHSTIIVGSNAFMLDGNSSPSIRARLAVAVLFAEDLSVDTLTVPGEDVSAAEREALEALLASCRLGIAFADG